MIKFNSFLLSIFGAILVGSVCGVSVVSSASIPIKDTTYSGKYVSQSVSDPITIGAGQSKTLTIKLKNTGKKTWSATGAGYVSAYTVSPNYHDSVFFDRATWISTDHPARILSAAKPGATTEIKITLRAPTKIGTYKEYFNLASEDNTWIKGAGFYLKINVVKSSGKPAETAEDDDSVQDNSDKANADYAVQKLAASLTGVTTTGGSRVDFTIKYFNSGKADWKGYSWSEAGSRRLDDGGGAAKIADESWIDNRQIFRSDTSVKSGDSLSASFVFRAPAKAGQYILRFQMMADGHTLNGGIYELPVTVTADAPADFTPVVFASTRALVSEPIIRVGLYKSKEPVEFESPYGYSLYFGSSTTPAITAVSAATLSYRDGVYSIVIDGTVTTSTDFIRLIPDESGDYFILKNYSRKLKAKGDVNFNTYRGTLEYHYSNKSDLPYVIEEVPLDYYIAGIAETSDGAAVEYIKAILIAARGYAYAQLAPVSDAHLFDVFPTTADQLYLGYNSELSMPRVVQAANDTYGEMVTYNGGTVVTPYFGRSNGHTKTWKEVWGGQDKPWLQRVECVYDKGKTLWGHGVGMSAQDSAKRADRDGWTYDQLLRYYYTGVEVEKIY